ncbi:cytochrome P450 [Kutzneria sp. NPDC052558]|uniref:cytochrome P450 n=1 Tax=Kutzneria sp. NPDC052558 TaxID=3364121 RepID=UPI0037C9140B
MREPMSTTTPSSAVPIAPGRLPIVGHLLEFRRDPMAFLTSLRESGEIVRIFLGPLQIYAVTSPQMVHRMLVTESASFDKGRLYEKMQGFVGKGLLTSNGSLHSEQRRLMQPAFQRKMIALYSEVMRARTEEMLANWHHGQVVDMQRTVDELTLRIGVSSLFSSDLSKEAVEVVEECLPVVLQGVLGRTVLPDFVFRFPLPAIRRLNTAEQRLRAIVDELVRTYRADDRDHGDLLTVLLAARDDTGHGMSDEQARDELITLMLAATETTSGVLASLFFRLTQNPAVERRVLAELDAVLGRRPVTYADIPALEYLGRVLSETLRLDMPADLFMRRAKTDVVLGDTPIAAGTELMFSIPSLHRNPEIFPEPTSFDPDRWVARPARDLPRGAYIPFGLGKRQCIGQSFAFVELAMIAATVLSRWTLSIAPGEVPVKEHRITTHFTNLKMVVEPRD